MKTPLEFVASSLARDAGGHERSAAAVAALNKMGMPLYGMQPPTGYSTKRTCG